METHSNSYKVRLGLFIIIGIVLFVLGIFIIGKQKNLFNPVFKLSANFKNVSGLQVGNMVRFSGINVGTVDNILIVNDSTVKVEMLLKQEVQPFIKSDSHAGISSEGIIGDKVVMLTHGNPNAKVVKDGQMIASFEPVETDAIMKSVAVTAENAAVLTDEMATLLVNINSGEGTLGKLIRDEEMAANIDQTIVNLKKSSKGLNENMEAAKHNFLLRGYFKKKEKAAEKAKEEAAEKAREALENANKEKAKKAKEAKKASQSKK
jgi:phospholipid/cholesterol/gamma-HCH transport system substrate-binding protein